MTLAAASQAVVNAGGAPTGTVSKNTNFLVMNTGEYAPLSVNGVSSKARKAVELAEAGKPIAVIDEGDYLQMIRQPVPQSGEPHPVGKEVLEVWEARLIDLEFELDDLEDELADMGLEDDHDDGWKPWDDLEAEIETGRYLQSGRKIPEAQIEEKREKVKAMKQRDANLPSIVEKKRKQIEGQ